MRVRFGGAAPRRRGPRSRWLPTAPAAPLIAALLLSAGFVLFMTLAYCHPVVVYHDVAENMKMTLQMCDPLRTAPLGVEAISTAGMAPPFNRSSYRYPPGYSLLLVIPYSLWGLPGLFLAGPLILFLTLMAFYHLCSRLTGGWTAVLALLLLAAIPSVTKNLVWGSTHVPTVLLVLVSLILLERWTRRRRTPDALLCGLSAGAIPLLRNPEITVTLAVGAAFLVAVLGRKPRRWMQWTIFCLGAAVPLVLLAAWNQASFGTPLTTGYQATGEQGAFSARYFLRNILPYAQLVLSECGAHLLLLAAGGLVLMWRTAGRRLVALAVSLILVTTSLLYVSYYWDPGTDGIRFFLPCLFLIVLLAAFCLRRLRTILPHGGGILVVAAVLLSLLTALPHFARTLPALSATGDIVDRVSAMVQTFCEPEEILVADISICTTLDVTADYTLRGYPMAQSGRVDWADWLKEASGEVGRFYLLAESSLIDTLERCLPRGCSLTLLARVEPIPFDALQPGWRVFRDLTSLQTLMDMNILYLMNSGGLGLVRIEDTRLPRKKPLRTEFPSG